MLWFGNKKVGKSFHVTPGTGEHTDAQGIKISYKTSSVRNTDRKPGVIFQMVK